MINLLIICLFVFSCEIYSGEVVGKSFLAKHFENKKEISNTHTIVINKNDSYRSIEVSKKRI